MRKIVVNFKSIRDIQNLKSVMKAVHSGKSDHIPDIERFNLGKMFAPSLVDRAEIKIATSSSNDTVVINKNFLTFLSGPYPFTRIAGDAEEEDSYIVLPWNLSTRVGVDGLQNLIRRIPSSATSIEYKIYLNSASGTRDDTDTASIASLASLHLSDIMAEDETESLLRRIDELTSRIRELEQLLTQKTQELETQKSLVTTKQREIANKDSVVYGLQSTISQLQSTNAGLQSANSQLQNANNGYCSQIAQLKSQASTGANVINFDCSVPNQTTVCCQGFTGKIIAETPPSNISIIAL